MLELYIVFVLGLVGNQAINGEPRDYEFHKKPLISVVREDRPRVHIVEWFGDTYLDEVQ